MLNKKNTNVILASILVFARLTPLLALPLEGLLGYGDFVHFFRLAGLPGWPFIDYWVEFPPVFPFLSEILYFAAGGQEHVYDYLLALVLLLADVGNLFVFRRLVEKLQPVSAVSRTGAYLIFLAVLPYCGWYFDPLAVLFLLLGIHWMLDQKAVGSGAALALGLLIKMFPVVVLAATWKYLSRRNAAIASAVLVVTAGLVYSGLWALAPETTSASIGAQAKKGSWETVWALFDGNYRTGNFGPEIERLDAANANQPQGNPARISPWLTLIVFAGMGLLAFTRTPTRSSSAAVALTGLALCLLWLWSPGWSPQWVLYLLPLLLLSLQFREAVLMAVTFVMVNLLEWPVLLSRGYFWALAVTAPLRWLLLLGAAGLFYQQIRRARLSTNRRPLDGGQPEPGSSGEPN